MKAVELNKMDTASYTKPYEIVQPSALNISFALLDIYPPDSV